METANLEAEAAKLTAEELAKLWPDGYEWNEETAREHRELTQDALKYLSPDGRRGLSVLAALLISGHLEGTDADALRSFWETEIDALAALTLNLDAVLDAPVHFPEA